VGRRGSNPQTTDPRLLNKIAAFVHTPTPPVFTLNLIAAASDSAILLGMIKTSTVQITIGGGGGGRILGGGGGGGR
jgi:hypothetical protein